jgi:hypothetical protein
MSEQTPLEPLDPELGALFDAERRHAPEPAAAQARVWKAVAAALVVPAAAGAGAAALQPGWLSAAKSFGVAKLTALGAALFIAGGVTGAALQHVLIEPALQEAPALQASPPGVKPERGPEPPLAPIVTPIEPAPEAAPPAPLRTRPVVPPRAQPQEEAAPAAPASLLAREQAIIDAARAALAGGHAGQALAALERHASEFSAGHLVEEREGLRILALVRAGRKDEATESSARFRAAYPRSVLLPAIDAALAASH